MRQRYRHRRDQLVGTLAERAPHVRPTGIAAGLHLVLQLPAGTEERTVRAAAVAGIALDGLAAFRHPAAGPASVDGLVVGCAAPSDHAFRSAVDALAGVLPPA